MGFLLAILLIVAAITAARVPAIAADDYSIVTGKAHPSDDCVGNPVTPICAVLTHKACELWDRAALCRRIGFTTKYLWGRVAPELEIFKLRIIDQRVLERRDIPDWKGNVGEWVKPGIKYETWRPGDLVVRVEFWRCEPDEKCTVSTRDDPTKTWGQGCPPDQCYRSESDPIYVLRRIGMTWHLLYYHFDPADHGAYWRAFWKRK